ncbi:uncharacterized protein LOC130183889 [Seriola aureovittata]|uniref:uncharacterized protein LOC130183889 n=1 Tax=Seriola aureovittata TaxID=2871759 RepID=UPI0024BE2F19|nr:uncharacterized protein LOC130183889 [Seriola aureovittata]
MSGTAGAEPPTAVLGLGLDISGPWHQRAVHKSRALVQTYLLTSSVQPPPAAGAGAGGGRGGRGGGAGGGGRGGGSGSTKAPLRLPSLVAAAKAPRRRSSMARLSLSEPSLLTPSENVHFEGSSTNRRPSVLQRRPPPPPPFSSSALLSCRSSQPDQQQVQSCSRPAYIHFSQAIRPGSRPRPVRRHSHNPALSADTGDLRPLATQYRNCSSHGEPLSVIGKPCLLSCSLRPGPAAAAGPARTQLHVFLPTEAEGEEADSESVDEGFMDELDSKMNSLKLQQTVTYH